MSADHRGASKLSRSGIENYLTACCGHHSPPRVTELARLLGVSREHLARAFMSRHGRKLCVTLKALQVARAKILLHATRLPVERIGYELGFGTPRSFFRTFRAVTGVTPSSYRRTSQSVSRQVSIVTDGVRRKNTQ